MPEPERALPVLPWTLIKFTPDAPPQEMVRGEPYMVSVDGQQVGIFHRFNNTEAAEWFDALPTAEQHEADIAQVRAQMHAMGLRGMPGQ